MHRIDVPTAAPTPPPRQEHGAPGYFTSGDFVAGIKATIPGPDWFNTVQAELTNAVEASGQALDRDDDTQLLQAIRTLIRKTRYIPGQVIAFAGTAVPEGTLHCNGAAVSRTDYADLFAAIGTTYGEGDGSTTFNVPLMKEGTTITHTNSAEFVGVHSPGEVIAHAHGASAAAVGDHTHYIGVYGAGGHAHAASSGAAGDHVHGAWTDEQGWHGHSGNTAGAGDHQHGGVLPSGPAFNGYGVYMERDGDARPMDGATAVGGHHGHSFNTDGAGNHGHNVGMNGVGHHTHDIGVAAVGDHAHNLDNQGAGAHEHAITVNTTGGSDNLPAGLRMLYCIAY